MTFESPELAEQAFYQAFQDADVQAMMAIWSPVGKVLCVHPMGPPLTTLEVIRASWLEIFAGDLNQRIDTQVVMEKRAETLCTRTVIENFSIPGRNEQFAPIIATNIFWRGDGSWYLISHHASPARAQASSGTTAQGQTRH